MKHVNRLIQFNQARQLVAITLLSNTRHLLSETCDCEVTCCTINAYWSPWIIATRFRLQREIVTHRPQLDF
jgi:hypothetical protein